MKLLTVLVLSMLACTACTNSGKRDVNACLQPTPPIVMVEPAPVVESP